MVWWLQRLRETEPSEEWKTALAPAREFLIALRCFLHFKVGRDANTLSFELQDEVAQQAYTQQKDPAAWMRDYFRHARLIHRTASKVIEAAEGPGGNLITQFRAWRSRLSNPEFTVARERLYFKSPHQLKSDPELVLRLFRYVARHGLRLAQDSERRIEDAMPEIRAYFSESRPLWPIITEILTLPHTALALEAMNETGVLSAVFPEWKRIECLVVRDFYHRYTVDEHTLVAIRALADLREGKDPSRKHLSELLAEVDHPALLTLALLFHDIGKGSGEGKHIDHSRPLVEAAMKRIQAPRNAFNAVWELIEQHLTLSAVMTSRDLDDPATARELASRVSTLEQLRNLTLVTYADISAVNPTAMTPWRMDQLWRVYLCAHHELTRELDTVRIQAPPVRSPELAAFLEGFPMRYLRMHTEEQMEAHFELQQRSHEIGAAIEIRRLNSVYQTEVVARDRTGLFAGIAGALSSFGMNIVKAEAFANNAGDILDTFTFSDPGRNLELNPTEVDRLRITIERVLLGRVEVKDLLRNRPRQAPTARSARIRPVVSFDSDASATSTLVEIVAEDRPGLLYDLASRISGAGCNIEVVLIDTEAHKALDVFYLTHDGKKLTPEQQGNLKEALLSACEG
jgi:[protein-PII] uridylyltransferase